MKCRDSAILRLPELMDFPGFALPPGTLLGNYKLLKVLGQGGFGITYIAWDNQLRRNIVLKECFPLGLCCRDSDTGEIIPLPHASRDVYQTSMDSLRREAQTLASLNHESIVRVYDVFESHGSIFYVMPWLEGGSLRERIDEAASGKSTITPEQAAEWILLLLDGVDYLHGKGIYHRDIKPGNILFDERGLPVLIDFGAALNKPEVTCTITQGEFSYAYASPEQITGKGEIGPWTDFYALAATWYELITGTSAEPADRRLMQDDVVPLSGMTFSQPWPRELLASIDRNLRLKPEERCQTAGQWREWLQQGKLVKLHKGNSRKNTLIVASLGLLVVIIILGIWTVNRLFVDKAEPPDQLVSETTGGNSIPSTPPSTPEIDQGTPDSSVQKIKSPAMDIPPLSKDASAILPKVLDYFQWEEQEKRLRGQINKASQNDEKFKEFIRQEVATRKQYIDQLKFPPRIMEEVIVDSQRKYYSPVWYDSVLLKSCRDSWQHVANSLSDMIAKIAQWQELYPSTSIREKEFVQEIASHEKRKLLIERTNLNKLEGSASDCLKTSEKEIRDYAYETGKNYYAQPIVTEEWQAREKYKIDAILGEIGQSKQKVIQQASEQIDKKKLFFEKVDNIISSFKTRQELRKWSEGDEIRQLEQEGKALDKEYDRIAEMEQNYLEKAGDYFNSFGGIKTLVPDNEVGWIDGFANELSDLVNWPTKGLKGWEQDANNYIWSKVRHASKSF